MKHKTGPCKGPTTYGVELALSLESEEAPAAGPQPAARAAAIHESEPSALPAGGASVGRTRLRRLLGLAVVAYAQDGDEANGHDAETDADDDAVGQLLGLLLVLHRLRVDDGGGRRVRGDDEVGRRGDGDPQRGGGGLGGAELGLDEVTHGIALHGRGHGDGRGDEHAAGLDGDRHERRVDAGGGGEVRLEAGRDVGRVVFDVAVGRHTDDDDLRRRRVGRRRRRRGRRRRGRRGRRHRRRAGREDGLLHGHAKGGLCRVEAHAAADEAAHGLWLEGTHEEQLGLGHAALLRQREDDLGAPEGGARHLDPRGLEVGDGGPEAGVGVGDRGLQCPHEGRRGHGRRRRRHRRRRWRLHRSHAGVAARTHLEGTEAGGVVTEGVDVVRRGGVHGGRRGVSHAVGGGRRW
eukprot:scaffold33091_cov61-Phaeocystis_antarctica.AAC.5